MWSTGGIIIREQKQRRIGDRGSWGRHNCVTCGVGVVKKHEIGGTEKQKVEEQNR